MSETEKIIDNIKNKFTQDILNTEVKSKRRATITIPGSALTKMADFLYSDMNFRFITASALESGKGFEIYYHFSNDKTGLVFNIHVVLPKNKPEIESLTCLFEAASWIEREMHEILGINFLNHPNLEKLISEGNWAEGVYPYRKEQQ
ncbi:MAG: NADH-quinone oxidoreductase subunit C [Bacteroidetes bacterium]|nr:NADH-quinone oxidoreductase subunit C [Bacteroidota bacterium]